MKPSTYFVIAGVSCYSSILLSYFVRMNPEFFAIHMMMKMAISLSISAYVYYEKPNKLIAIAILVGTWLGTFSGYYDFLRNWFIWFQSDVLFLTGLIIVLAVIALIGGYHVRKSNN